MTNDRNMGNIETANQSNLVSAHGIFNTNAMADTIMKKYLKKYIPTDKSSTMEMWRLREQARMVAEEVVLMDVVNRYR